jgi:hypothetical protein
MPNVISKIKQNSSDMNEIILGTLRCRLCTKLYWFFVKLIFFAVIGYTYGVHINTFLVGLCAEMGLLWFLCFSSFKTPPPHALRIWKA